MGKLDLTFLSTPRPEPAGHMFFENTHQVPRETAGSQEAIARLDLNYYIPCRAQQKTVAVLGLGKTTKGDYLSSEDVELLETLGGYLGIAIQNGRLYASLQQKVAEYERLKDFNENIVESINVGVMALDMEDRIESWNAQMEVMYALPRWQTLTQPVRSIFPPEFVEEFYRVRQNAGINNLYKFRLQTPAGETRTVNVAIAPLVTRKFQVIGRLVIMDDITERVELEGQLSQADKLSSIGLLAAGVAHEVNTPLAVISSYTQMLAKQLQGDPAEVRIAGEDHAADVPRFGDRQQPAELLAHQRHGIRRRRHQQSHYRHAGAAGAPVQDREDSGALRTDSEDLCDSGQSRAAAAGVPESVPQRERRHAGRRHSCNVATDAMATW